MLGFVCGMPGKGWCGTKLREALIAGIIRAHGLQRQMWPARRQPAAAARGTAPAASPARSWAGRGRWQRGRWRTAGTGLPPPRSSPRWHHLRKPPGTLRPAQSGRRPLQDGGRGVMGGLVCENGSCSNTTQVGPAPAKTCTAGCKTATSAPPCLTRVETILAGDVSHGQHWFQLKAVFLSRQRVAAVACGRGKGCV